MNRHWAQACNTQRNASTLCSCKPLHTTNTHTHSTCSTTTLQSSKKGEASALIWFVETRKLIIYHSTGSCYYQITHTHCTTHWWIESRDKVAHGQRRKLKRNRQDHHNKTPDWLHSTVHFKKKQKQKTTAALKGWKARRNESPKKVSERTQRRREKE